MYPLRINLLTPDKKKHLIQVAQFKFVQNILQVVLVAISFEAICLMLSIILLQIYFSGIASNVVNVSNKYTAQSKDIISINQLTQKVDKIQQQYHPVTPTLMAVADLVPKGIVLNALNIDYEKKTISFSGLADTRQNFLDFQKALNDSTIFLHAESPVSDLTKKENIAFNINANLK